MEIIQALQSIKNEFFDAFFVGVTKLGEEFWVSVIFAIVYFAVDKQLGKKLGYALFSSICFNTAAKDIVREPRPISASWNRPLYTETATGYSFPSGHSQVAATAYPVLAIRLKKVWGWIVCGLIVFLVGVSRLYLGVHWPIDVLCGWAFGLAFAFGISYVYDAFGHWTGLLALVFVPGLFFLDAEDVFKSVGMFAGFAICMPLEDRYIKFTMEIPLWKKLVRLFAGLAYIIAWKLLFDRIFPTGNFADLVQYFLLSVLGFFVYPFIFTKCRF